MTVLDESLAVSGRVEGIERFVVGAVIHRDGAALVVTRAAADEFLPGVDELPSGGVEAGETLHGALLREIAEEVGLALQTIDDGFLEAFDYSSADGRRTRQITVSMPAPDGEVRLSDEHSAARWITAEAMDSISCTSETRAVLAAWFGAFSQCDDG